MHLNPGGTTTLFRNTAAPAGTTEPTHNSAKLPPAIFNIGGRALVPMLMKRCGRLARAHSMTARGSTTAPTTYPVSTERVLALICSMSTSWYAPILAYTPG